MLDKLKSLPLTIFLTILIWMYAEAQVSSSRKAESLTVKGVPVTLSGPPDVLKTVLRQFDVVLDPPQVEVVVEGAPDYIAALRDQTLGGASVTGIRAYVELTAEDGGIGGGGAGGGNGVVLSRKLRVLAPGEVAVLQAPDSVSVRLVAKPATATHGIARAD